MDTLSYKTISANSATVTKGWLLINAENVILGRMASRIAGLLRGKHKPYFTNHTDCGDCIVVINAEKVRLTGNKWDGRKHFSYSGYPGGHKSMTPRQIHAKNPVTLVEEAVRRMLPKNRLGSLQLGNLHVYSGNEHPHAAQQPKTCDINSIK